MIRSRHDDDLADLETLARSVHAADNYPPYMPDDDFVGFIASPEALAAWVAIVDDQVVGHIALHTRSSAPVMDLASDALAADLDRFAVVARLLVSPTHRRSGIAQALLDTALQESADRNLIPLLDVVESFTSAVALYERQGWHRLGTVDVGLPDGTTLREHVYVGPSHAPPTIPPPPRPPHVWLDPPVLEGPTNTTKVKSRPAPHTWKSRTRLGAAAFIISFAVCFCWPAGLNGLLLFCALSILAGLMLRQAIQDVGIEQSLDPLNLMILWAAVSFPFFNLGLVLILIWIFLWLLGSLALGLTVIVWGLIAHRLQLVAGIAIVGLVYVTIGPFYDATHVPLRALQVRLAETHLQNSGPLSVTGEGVEVWTWIGVGPDGGTGPASDPSHRLDDPDFATDSIWEATGDPGSCKHLYDDWYWCG